MSRGRTAASPAVLPAPYVDKLRRGRTLRDMYDDLPPRGRGRCKYDNFLRDQFMREAVRLAVENDPTTNARQGCLVLNEILPHIGLKAIETVIYRPPHLFGKK